MMEPPHSHSWGCLFIQCSLMLFIVSSSYGMWLVLLLNCIPFCFASLVKQVNYFVRLLVLEGIECFISLGLHIAFVLFLAVRRNAMDV